MKRITHSICANSVRIQGRFGPWSAVASAARHRFGCPDKLKVVKARSSLRSAGALQNNHLPSHAKPRDRIREDHNFGGRPQDFIAVSIGKDFGQR